MFDQTSILTEDAGIVYFNEIRNGISSKRGKKAVANTTRRRRG
jgi:hypothetical protein